MVWAVPLRLSAGPQAVRTAAQTGQHLSHNRDKETLASINMLHKINGLSRCAGEGFGIISGPNLYLDVHFISSLPVILRSACKAWVDRGPVQIVAAED
jgi:hypothetical protein